MEPSEFYTIVRQQTDLESVEEAETLAEAVLETLGERLSAGAVEDLTGFLPDELAAHLEADDEPEDFDVEEFIARVADRAGVDEEFAQRGTLATTDALAEAAPGSEYRDARQQLPAEYGMLFQAAEDAEGRVA
jgi:uncharacterized protein (DUF2267 family)